MSIFVPAVAPKSRDVIEDEATKYLQAFFPSLLHTPGALDVIEAFDSLPESKQFSHLEVGVEELPAGIEGISYPDGRVILSKDTYLGAVNGIGRCRFTVAHEIYHAIAHQPQISHAIVDTNKVMLYRRQDIPAYRDPEWQANTFAAAVLMPRAMVRKVIERTARHLHSTLLSRTFGVSDEAASIRLKHIAQ